MLIEEKIICKSGKKDAPFFAWPWENFGNYKVCTLSTSLFKPTTPPLVNFRFFPSFSLVMYCLLICAFYMCQYLLYGPLIAKGLYSMSGKGNKEDIWCLHILVLFALRGLVHQLWSTYNNSLYINRTRRLNQQGIDFNQIDAEWHWYKFVISHILVYVFF